MSEEKNPILGEVVNCPDESHKLRRMDILLTRHRGHIFRNFVSRTISRFTRCYWSHVAAVFLVPDHDESFNNTFVMESYGPGVDIHRMEKYLSTHREYDVAVLRLRADWFTGLQGGLPASDETEKEEDVSEETEKKKKEEREKLEKEEKDKRALRRRARGRLLDKVDAGYDRAKVWAGIWRFLKKGPSGVLKTIRFKSRRRKQEDRKDVKKGPTDFMCSGFVSYGLYETVLKECEMNEISLESDDGEKMLKSVLLHPALLKNPEGVPREDVRDLVLSTVPADFVNDEIFEWKWMVLAGEKKAHRFKKGDTKEALDYFDSVYGLDFCNYPRRCCWWEPGPRKRKKEASG